MYENGELLKQTAPITRDYSNYERSIEDFVQEIFADFKLKQSNLEGISFHRGFVYDGICGIICQCHRKVDTDKYLGWQGQLYYVFKDNQQAYSVVGALNKYCQEM